MEEVSLRIVRWEPSCFLWESSLILLSYFDHSNASSGTLCIGRLFSEVTGLNWSCVRVCKICYMDSSYSPSVMWNASTCMALLFSEVLLLDGQHGRHIWSQKGGLSFILLMNATYLLTNHWVLKPFDPASRCYQHEATKPLLPSAAVWSVMLSVSSAEGWGWWLLGFGPVAHGWMVENACLWDMAVVGLFRTLWSTLDSDGTLCNFHSSKIVLLACCWPEVLA